jgi:flagellar basal body rod protein FlgB
MKLFGLIERTTSASPLKAALDKSVDRSRGIADRVAKATVNSGDGFALEAKTGNAQATVNPVNVEDEMVSLADEQLRFLATSRLLEKTYQSLRTAIKGGGG